MKHTPLKPEVTERTNDVPSLSATDEPETQNILKTIESRYREMDTMHCYTLISPISTGTSTILVTVNPYRDLPIYGDDTIHEYHQLQKNNRLFTSKPHPFGVAAQCYDSMISSRCNQAIIIRGLSGSGKTQTAKSIMKYLAMTATDVHDSPTDKQIIATYPILEAFGNAKTCINKNASRFASFTKIYYDVPLGFTKANQLGAYLETYLLETSRVIHQTP
eukprot:890543_1